VKLSHTSCRDHVDQAVWAERAHAEVGTLYPTERIDENLGGAMSRRLRSYQRTLVKSPHDARAWYGLAVELIALGEIESACTALRESAARSENAALCASAGRLLAMHGKPAFAVDALRKALPLSGGDKEVAIDLARSLLATGNSLAAVELLRSYVSTPSDPDVCLLFASALVREGFDSEGADHLERGLETNPSHVASLRLLGHIRLRIRQSAEALECMRRVLALTAATEVDDLSAYARALADLGEHGEAVRILGEARRRSPGSYEILANLGTAYLATGATAAAIEVLGEATRAQPQGAHAHCMLGLALHQEGRSIEAIDRMKEAARLAPHWAAAHFNLGKLLHAMGDFVGAKNALNEAHRLAPDDADVRGALEQVPNKGKEDGRGITGDLEMFRLPDLLEFLRLQRSTGILVLGARRGAGLVRLFEGALTAASAPSTPRLGEILVQQGAIDRATIDQVIAAQGSDAVESEELLGSILLEQQLIAMEPLEKAMMEQVTSAIGEMMTWTSGHFAFHTRPPASRPAITFDAQGLMMEVFRRSDEAHRDDQI
jgi:tetratricopeptide (TPR) repeat protein